MSQEEAKPVRSFEPMQSRDTAEKWTGVWRRSEFSVQDVQNAAQLLEELAQKGREQPTGAAWHQQEDSASPDAPPPLEENDAEEREILADQMAAWEFIGNVQDDPSIESKFIVEFQIRLNRLKKARSAQIWSASMHKMSGLRERAAIRRTAIDIRDSLEHHELALINTALGEAYKQVITPQKGPDAYQSSIPPFLRILDCGKPGCPIHGKSNPSPEETSAFFKEADILIGKVNLI
jgi:hypothetical protein